MGGVHGGVVGVLLRAADDAVAVDVVLVEEDRHLRLEVGPDLREEGWR